MQDATLLRLALTEGCAFSGLIQRASLTRAERAEPCDWSEGRHNNVGVSLREMRGTTQVMLGVSLRADGAQL